VAWSSLSDAKSPSVVKADGSTYLQPEAPPSLGSMSSNVSLISTKTCSHTLPDKS